MKKIKKCNSLKALSAVLLIILSACTSDFYETPTSIERLNSLKDKIYRYAEEYGVNVTTNDSILIKNLDVTDEEIENRMKLLSKIPGTYIGIRNNKGVFNMKKLEKNITRSVSWSPEIWQGTVSDDVFINSTYSFSIELEYYYNQTANSYIRCSSAVFHVRKMGGGLNPYEDDINADLSNDYSNFVGSKGFTYSATITCVDKYSSVSWVMVCVYDHDHLTCTIN